MADSTVGLLRNTLWHIFARRQGEYSTASNSVCKDSLIPSRDFSLCDPDFVGYSEHRNMFSLVVLKEDL